MRCIFCLNDRPGSLEHVFPFAIGGCLTTDRVCEPCNSMLGSRVDKALTDNFVVRTHRALTGMAGNSGAAPPLHETLEGVGELAGYPGRRVHISYNEATNRLDAKALPVVTPLETPDGVQGCHIILDEKDLDKLPRIIQRERKKHGFPPLTEEQLATEVARFAASVEVIQNPQVIFRKTCKFDFVSHALFKIAYELAFLWLGESYLDDPSAAALRTAICSKDSNSTTRLPARALPAEECSAFFFCSQERKHHIAYAFANHEGIAIAIRVFDIHAAWIWVANDASRYIRDSDGWDRLKLVEMDSENRTMRETQVLEEMNRFARAEVSRAREAMSHVSHPGS
jgi:hypothetical protein